MRKKKNAELQHFMQQICKLDALVHIRLLWMCSLSAGSHSFCLVCLCFSRVSLLLGYSPAELLGRSIYDLCHTLDTNCLTKNHVNCRSSQAQTHPRSPNTWINISSLSVPAVCCKTQSVSGQYRMLVKGGGYVWVESHSAVIPSSRSSKSRPRGPQSLCILSVTYVLRCVLIDFTLL